MKSKINVEKALEEYVRLPAIAFMEKYRLETIREAEGIVKALKWLLKEKETTK